MRTLTLTKTRVVDQFLEGQGVKFLILKNLRSLGSWDTYPIEPGNFHPFLWSESRMQLYMHKFKNISATNANHADLYNNDNNIDYS